MIKSYYFTERGFVIMERIQLKMEAQSKYETIKSLVDHKNCSDFTSRKKRAAVQLNCTLRTINRLIKRYEANGKSAFVHGNRGRKPAHALSEERAAEILTLYTNKYYDATFAYACELLAEHDGISISPSALSSLMYRHHMTSPRTTKKKRKQLADQLRARQKETVSKKQKQQLQEAIVAIENAHPRRPRAAYFGEMVQMDASVHLWFGEKKTNLHIAVDDSTGQIIGAYFDNQETLKGYYNVFYQILTTHGIPAMFYTDRRTVFEYRNSRSQKMEQDTFTQFHYACQQLGVDLKTTSIPQAKGRVERAFQTLQQRLPIALRLAGISTITEANAFLHSYIEKYNAKFALPAYSSRSVFEMQPDHEKICQTLAVLTERTIDAGHCIRFRNRYYQLMDSRGLQVCYLKGTKGLVIQTFHGRLLFSTNDRIYELDPVPERAETSPVFDAPTHKKPRKRNIPSAAHPWRRETFLKFRDHCLTEEMLIC